MMWRTANKTERHGARSFKVSSRFTSASDGVQVETSLRSCGAILSDREAGKLVVVPGSKALRKAALTAALIS
jgi:hypothetical protein